jgi:DnaK suppressor protein
MNESDKEILRNRILDELVEARVKIAELEESSKPVAPDKSLGRLTRLEVMQDRSVAEAALNRARSEQTRLENALQNIVLPAFGSCNNCGAAIPMERMEALPQSTLCIACAGR